MCVNKKENALYRTIFHLKTGKESHNLNFAKYAYRLPKSVTPTIIWYQGDETLHVPVPHGNSNNRNQIFIRSKPSDMIELTEICTQDKRKPHIIYKNNQGKLILLK